MDNAIRRLYQQGQSVWCDSLSRRMIESGELQRLVDLGVVGVTSNPTIFMKAIGGSADYDPLLEKLLDTEPDVRRLYERLALPDIIDAADILKPVYEQTNGVDGYVSLEVNPKLAFSTSGTVTEARRLFAELNRPNVLIKVPGTEQGIPAIETLIGEGINVNVTLVFSVTMYKRVMRAYLDGLKRWDARGGDLSKVASVASFFVSRVDTLVDKLLEAKRRDFVNVDGLPGTAAIANAKLAYARFVETFDPSREFGALASRGARVQRPLWASTSTKNPAYSDTKYVDGLVGPRTVNTMPPETIEATLDHGGTNVTLTTGVDEARSVAARLGNLGMDLTSVGDQLLTEGVELFARSFEELLSHLIRKKDHARFAVTSADKAPAHAHPTTAP